MQGGDAGDGAVGGVLDLGPPPPGCSLARPVPAGLHRLLRLAVVAHGRDEHRRVFAPVVHVGTPGAEVVTLTLGDQRLDHALRVDALEAMVRRTRGADGSPALVWLTRPGSCETRDVDLVWHAATRSAAAELGRRLPMVVVTRRSWHDPSSDVRREWVRLRA